MGRRPATMPTVKLTTTLPQDVHTQLSLHLYSEIDGAIPPGAFQSFLSARIREFFASKSLDLAPYIGSAPGDFIIRGSPSAIGLLIRVLQGD